MGVATLVDPAYQAHSVLSNPQAAAEASHSRWNAISQGHPGSALAEYWNDPGTAITQDINTLRASKNPFVSGAVHALESNPVGAAVLNPYTTALAGNLVGGTAHLLVDQGKLYGPVVAEYAVPGGVAFNRTMGIKDPLGDVGREWHRDPWGSAARGLSTAAMAAGGVGGVARAGAAGAARAGAAGAAGTAARAGAAESAAGAAEESAAGGAARGVIPRAESPVAPVPQGELPGRVLPRGSEQRSARPGNPAGDRPLGNAGQRPSSRSDSTGPGNRPPDGPGGRIPGATDRPDSPQLSTIGNGAKPSTASANSAYRPLAPPGGRPAGGAAREIGGGNGIDGPPSAGPVPGGAARDGGTTPTGESPPGPTPPGGLNKLDDPSLASAPRYANKMPEDLAGELAEASQLGVKPVSPASPKFESIVNSGPVKWAVLQNGDIAVVPKWVGLDEIKHSVLSGGQPVLAAGEADIVGSAKTGYLGVHISNESGHFRPPPTSLELAVKQFERAGIEFHDDVISPR
jgi:hypothetical protein